jgi:hypothetical protein
MIAVFFVLLFIYFEGVLSINGAMQFFFLSHSMIVSLFLSDTFFYISSAIIAAKI